MPARDIRNEIKPEQVLDAMKQEEQGGIAMNPLLLNMTEEEQKVLVSIIMEDYRNALEARQKKEWGTDKNGEGIDFETKYADLISLYEGNDEKRPEKWMCGRSLKIAQSIVELMVARLFPAIWNENTVRWKPVEFTDKQYVERINKIMKWVTTVWMKMRRDVLGLTRVSAMVGTAYVETYWKKKYRDLDRVEQRPVVDEMGQQQMNPDGTPMYIEDRLLQVDERPALKLIPITKLLTQPGQTDIQEEPIIIYEDFYYHELESLFKQGLMVNVDEKLKTAVDKSLFDKFGSELEKAEKISELNAKRRSTSVECIRWQGAYDADKDGFEEEISCTVALKEEIFLRAFKLCKVNRKGKRPITKINFLDRIHKFLGIGVLEQVKPLAEEIDACFRQLQDANTLSIMKWGFYDPNSDYDPNEHVAKPRAMYPVTNPAQNVYFPDMNIPIERLLNAIRLVLEFIERLTAASSYALGKESDIVGGSGTATRVNEISQSANIRFNLPADNLREGVADILTNIFDLCSMNMPQGLEKRIIGDDGQPIFETYDAVKDAMALEMDAYVVPSGDMGDVSVQRELAVILYDKFVLGGNPLVTADINRLWMASANILKAYGEEPVEWLGKPQTMKETSDPTLENNMIRSGRIVHVEPQENHLEHIVVHEKMMSGNPEILLWPKEAIELLRVHVDEHKQMMQIVMQFQQNQKKGGGLGNQEAKPGKPGQSQGGSASNGQQPSIQNAGGPGGSTASKQAAGTTQGTPAVQ